MRTAPLSLLVLCLVLHPAYRLFAQDAKGGKPRLDALGDPLPDGALARLGTPRPRSEQDRNGTALSVASVGFTGDGKTLISADESTVCLWDAATGKERRRFVPTTEDRGRRLQIHAISPNGKYLAANDTISTVCLMDILSGKEVLAVTPTSGNYVWPAGFSGQGSHLVVAEHRGYRVVDLSAGREVRRFEVDSDRHRFALSPDGSVLASATVPRDAEGAELRTCEVRLWDVATGRERGMAGMDREQYHALAFSSDGTFVAAAGSGRAVRFWDAGRVWTTGRIPIDSGSLSQLRFSPDGRTLAALAGGHGERKLLLWEMASLTLRREFSVPRTGVTCLAFSPDGRILATGQADSTVLLWGTLGNPENDGRADRPSARELVGLWSDLDIPNASRVLRAMRGLVAAPKETVELLRKHLRPVDGKAAPGRAIDTLIANLDDDSFEVREKATQELERGGPVTRAAIETALEQKPSLEKRRRLEKALEKLIQIAPADELLRPLRAIEVLERIGTPEARQFLKDLASGAADARLTSEARAALRRLEAP